ncbi:MAG: hypothetical protein AABZ47_16870 [Planctomycetota bacterium]
MKPIRLLGVSFCLAAALGSQSQAALSVIASIVLPSDNIVTGNDMISIEFFFSSDVFQRVKGAQAGMFCNPTSGSTTLNVIPLGVVGNATSSAGLAPVCSGGLIAISQPNCFLSRTPLPLAPPCEMQANTLYYMATITYDVSDCSADPITITQEPANVADGVPAVTDETRARDDAAGQGNLIPFVIAIGVPLTIPVGRCCDGQSCLGVQNQYCCATVNGGVWAPGLDCSLGCPCTNNAECSDGLFCTGNEQCIASFCQAGSNPCTNPNKPFCDEAIDLCVFCFNDAECDDGIFCTGVETCVNGNCVAGVNLPGGTACGDPTDTDCTNPDTCNGFGACVVNNAPAGQPCDDGLFCTEGTSCSGGLCVGGAPLNCSDSQACTADVCNEALDQCDHNLLPGFCFIGGFCFADGLMNPQDECEICDATGDPNNWSNKPDGTSCTDDGNDCSNDICMAGGCAHPNHPSGTPCDDGDPCTGTGDPGVGIDECDGLGGCAGLPDPDCNDDCETAVLITEGKTPGNNTTAGTDDSEASCQPDSNNDVWFKYIATCSGPLHINTNGSDFTPSNDTVLSVYDACDNPTEIACDDDGGFGLLSALTFDATQGTMYFIRVAGFQNNVGDISLTVRPVTDCVIDGICYAEGEVNPANECEACIPDVSTSAWSPRLKGTACGDPADTDCDSPDSCNGQGACEPNSKPDGTACTTDNNECTTDLCGGGVCLHNNLGAGMACGSPVDTDCDNPDTCNGAGMCQSNLESAGTNCGNPSNTDCDNPDTCDGSGTCLANLESDGTVCTDDGNDCKDDVCQAGVCEHPNEPAGTTCGDPLNSDCDNPDTCNGFGFCQDNLEPDGFPCSDSDGCTINDMCATGFCIGVGVVQAPIVTGIGPRFIQVDVLLGPAVPVALRLTSPDYPCLLKWLDGAGNIVNAPVLLLPSAWGTLIVGGAEIAPNTTYEVREECGSHLSAPGSDDTFVWGDVNNSGVVDLDDVTLMLDGYAGIFVGATLENLDLYPCEGPTGIIDLDDLILLLAAFANEPYPCAAPC